MLAIARRTALAIVTGSLLAAAVATPTANAAAASFAAPGCEASLNERLDWAIARDIELDTARPTDTPSEALRRMYALARLCPGDVIQQSGQTLRGPKEPGVAPSILFQPTGVTKLNVKRKGRTGRVLTCTNTAYDPQFSGGQVRGGGRSSCNQSAALSVTTCVGRYYQSSGNTDQALCNAGSTTGSAITVYTAYGTCYDVISYRTNFYGVTGNSYSLYFNGLYNGCN